MAEKFHEIYGKKALKALAGFLCVMLFLTVLSRAAASILTPYVGVVQPGKGSLTYKVSAAGTVEENQVRAVITAPGIRVKSVFVKEGDQVQKGDPLFEIDMPDLREKILLKKHELEKLDLGISDIKDRNKLEQTEKSVEQRRAAEDYNSVSGTSGVQVQRAYEAMVKAGDRLKDFDAQGSNLSGDELFSSGDPVEQALTDTCHEKAALMEDRAAQVQEKREELKMAEAEEDTQMFSDTVVTESMPLEPEDSQAMPEQTTEAAETEALFGTGISGSRVDQLKKELNEAEALYEAAKREKEEADIALAKYQTEQEALDSKDTQEQRRALEEAYIQAKNAYQDALKQQEESLSGAGRKIEDAGKPQVQDSTQKTMELDREVLAMELDKYLSLEEEKGIVRAPGAGVIRKLAVEAGYPTSDTSAVTMADLSAGIRLTAVISAEEAAHISMGDEIAVKPSDGSKAIEGLTIDSIRKNAENEELFDIAVRITDNQLKLGTSAVIEAEKKSMSYSTTLPLQALHLDKGQYYILVVQEVQSVLGTELRAQRFDVNVKEKTKDMAALEEGALSGSDLVILSSEKTVEAGDRVRLKEE